MITFTINVTADWPEAMTILRRIDRKLSALQAQGEAMSAELDFLTQEVEEEANATKALIDVTNNLAERLEALADDPVAIRALAAQLQANQDLIAATVLRHTPADPEAPPPVPEPVPVPADDTSAGGGGNDGV